jgi:uncharacterized protein YndB with AHSA1/START domain
MRQPRQTGSPGPVFASALFHAVTLARPARVWGMLTRTGTPLAHLYGMTAESSWQPGCAVMMSAPGHERLTGEVLAADPPRRLCYTLGDRPGEPAAYVSWDLRATDGATVIRLYVDEPRPSPTAIEDIEIAWLPVLSRLVKDLDQDH